MRMTNKKKFQLWDMSMARQTFVYLRPIVADLRVAYMALVHAWVVAERNPHDPHAAAEVERAENKTRAFIKEMEAIGDCPEGRGGLKMYQHFATGIVFFPAMTVTGTDLLYLVWRDTRDDITTYVVVNELDKHEMRDLVAVERRIPREWVGGRSRKRRPSRKEGDGPG